MSKRILLQIDDKIIKGMTIKYLIEPGYEIIEILGYDDLLYKLSIYPDDFCLFIIEINNNSLVSIFKKISDIKQKGFLKNTPILGFILDDTRDIVNLAIKSGFNDLILIPDNKASFKKQLYMKLGFLIKEFNPIMPDKEYFDTEIVSIEKIKELVNNEISFAKRGKYPVSFIMIRFANLKENLVCKAGNYLSDILRKTDKVYRLASNVWIIICPYTEKKHIVNVEYKIYKILRKKTGINSTVKYVSLGMASYPQDSENFDEILEILEAGIKTNFTINNLRGTLSSVPKNELDNYKRILEQYKYLSMRKKNNP